jgi:hypothetical protein
MLLKAEWPLEDLVALARIIEIEHREWLAAQKIGANVEIPDI